MSSSNRVGKSIPISGSQSRVITFEIDPGFAGKRLDSFLTSQLPDLSRSQIKRLIDGCLIKAASGKAVKCGQKLRGGESIIVTIPEPTPIEATPEPIPLNILYEDNSIIVIDKPAGIVVHPAAGHSKGTLVNALLFHCKDLSGV